MVTAEIVAAIQRSAGSEAQVTIRPGATPNRFNIFAGPAADTISAALSSSSQAEALRRPFSEIARRHGMELATAGSADALQFDFSVDGDVTQTVLLHFPAKARVATRSGPQPNEPGEGKGPKLAIILDDVGNDQDAANSLLALPYPLTLSILPHLPLSTDIADAAAKRGDEVMLHLPMQSESASTPAEAIELRVGMPADEVRSVLTGMLETVPHASGVNNHEGSKATADTALMDSLMPALHERGLFFIDSRTTASTVAADAARQFGVPTASRKVFLDDTQTSSAIQEQVELAARDADQKGSAIAIGHPHPETIAVLREELPRLKQRGIRLVFASDLVH